MKRSMRGAVAVIAGLALAVPGVANAAPSTSPAADPDNQFTPSNQTVRVMVVLDDQPTAATTPQEAAFVSDQDAKLADWSTRFDVDVRRQFGYLVNAFSADMPENRMADLASQPGVRSVSKARTYQPADAHSDDLTRTVLARQQSQVDGTGMVVAVIDTGIDAQHRDMKLSEAGAAGAAITNVKPGDQFSLKVPYGHNFADENDVVKDLTASQHGMHVAGIVAANGGPDADPVANGHINGAAPEAQLLAMKVFSNDAAKSGSAYDDDIIAAIEDSVKHGADVINMSLGSSNGFSGSDFGMQKAIRTATDAGTFVVVSAGNAGLVSSASGGTDDNYGTLDDGTVGGPSTATDALSIASVEGAAVVQPKAETYIGGATTPEFTFAYSHQAGDLLSTPTPVADGGVGRPEELGAVRGKVALVKRGVLNFSEKVHNALAAGAVGVIVWNHEAGGEEFVSMAGLEDVTDFVSFIGNAAGAHLLADLTAGKDVRVAFTDQVISQPNAAVLTPSTFTSWGPTPSLDFKPELSGIGGNVYSTLNDDTYGTMSGTSMAAPEIAGISALLLQKLEKDNPEMSSADRLARVRTSLMNTAQILKDADGTPFAPRQVGAGLAQTADAINTDVTATVDGLPQVALREITASRTVTVTLSNRGSVPRSYSTGSIVLNETNEPGEEISTHLVDDESAIASTKTVTVPAGGQASVDFTVTPNAGRDDHYLEGWLQFTSGDDSQPDLAVPFLGFVGDWNAEAVVDAPLASPDSVMGSLFAGERIGTQLLTRFGDSTYYTGDPAWISPNGDGDADVVLPAVSLLRSATHIDYQVLDESGKTVLAQPGQANEVSPVLLADVITGESSGMRIASEALFDGMVWNAATAKEERIADGHYVFRIAATVAQGFRPQRVDLPFGIDTVVPTLTRGTTTHSGDDLVLAYSFTDDASGWGGAQATVGYAGSPATVSKPDDHGTFTVTVPGAGKDPEAAHHVVVTASDAAGNSVSDTQVLAPGFVVENRAALSASPFNDASTDVDGTPLVSDGAVSAQLLATEGVSSVAVEGSDPVDVDPRTHRATVRIPVQANTAREVLLIGLDAEGKEVVTDDPLTLTYDTVKPELSLTSPSSGQDGLVRAADGVVTVSGTVSDNLSTSPTVLVNGKAVEVSQGAFSVELKDLTSRVLSVVASDGVNTTQKVLVLDASAVSAAPLIDSMSVDPSRSPLVAFNASSAGISKAQDGTPVLTVSGRLNRKPSTFSIGGRDVTVAEDGSFSHEVPLATGLNDTNFTLVDTDGTPVLATGLKIYYDETAPELTLERPTLHPGEGGTPTLFTNSSPVTLEGTIQDDTTGYTLSVNADVVKAFSSLADMGAANQQKWSWTGGVADKDTLRLRAVDEVGNGLDTLIPVVVDTDKPVLSLTGVGNGQVVTAGTDTPVTITASDAHLDTVEVDVDGAAVDVTRSDDGSATAVVAAGALSSGVHTINALVTDYAGNLSSVSVTFSVNGAPVIEGPDSVTVNPDDDGWKDSILGNWKVTDDQEGATLSADLSRLVLGSNDVVLTATDSQGATTTRTVEVVVERPLSVLTSGCVSMEARFVRGDALDAKCSTSGNRTTVAVSNTGAAIEGRLTVQATDVVQVLHQVEGHWLPVAFEKVEGGVSFWGSSDAVYVLVGPDQAAPGEDSGGAGDGTGRPASVTGGPGSLSRTGGDVQGLLVLGGLLALGGAATWGVSRRRNARN